MRKILITIFSVVSFSSSAWAGLALSSINAMNVTFYGMYTSADPTCQTGLVATIPLSATSQTVNLVSGPTLGNGSVSGSINCVVFVMKNTITYGWNAGNYTSSSSGGSDNVCNSGGTLPQQVCRNQSLTYPSQITTDAAKAGLTLASSCPSSPTGSEVIPVFISTDAACVGQSSVDTGSCLSGGNSTNTAFQAPTAAGDTLHGLKLSAPSSGASSYTLVINPAQNIGNSSGSCQSTSPPAFSLRN